jgi:integrase
VAGGDRIVSALAEDLQDYLRMRRGLGFALTRIDNNLQRFVAYLDAAGERTVTVELAVAWAQLSANIKPITVCFRLSAVRGFAHYLHAVDPANQIPPPGLLAVPRRRPEPHVYSASELALLLATARRLRPALRAATHQALIGLLASCGMRVGEALALTRDDVDLADGVITIRYAKFDRAGWCRCIPASPRRCAATPPHGTTSAQPQTDRYFLSCRGCALRREEAERIFRTITVGIRLRTDTARPRIHDYADLRVMPTSVRTSCLAW